MKSPKQISRLVVLASFLACFCLFGFRSTFSVLQGSMSSDLTATTGVEWTGTMLSTGYSLMMMIYAVTSFFAGRIVDKLGCRPVYLIASVFCFIGMFATSFVDDFIFYCVSYGLFAGIGTGMLWVSSTASVRKWFIGDKYSTAWGIAFAGAPIAQVILSVFLAPILKSDPSLWRLSMKVFAFLFLALLIIAGLVARKNPDDYGFKPFGTLPAKEGVAPSHDYSLSEAFRTYPIWAAILAFLGSMLGEFLIWSQIVKFFQTNIGLDITTATNLYVIIGVCGIVTMPVLGKLCDGFVKKVGNEAKGRKYSLIFAPICGIVGCILLLVMTKDTVWLGAAACVIFSLYWAIEPGGVAGYAGSIYGSKSFGKIWGLATLIVMFIGPATGSFMGGFLPSVTDGTYTASVIFALCGYIFSLVFACTMPTKLNPPKN
ncbi:MAG: MFS transporter [Collinsella sp.]|nr:MFS transporter [Collinsella sp.]